MKGCCFPFLDLITSPEKMKAFLQRNDDFRPDALAILGVEGSSLSYCRLSRHIEETGAQLNSWGIGRNDRIALALPNGPEMATAFLSIASVATCAPLNPAYSKTEFEFFLTDLKAKALIVLAGEDSPARQVAHDRNIPVIELATGGEGEAGIFQLKLLASLAPSPGIEKGSAQPEDIALVLHTSGTTARPKIVPLTQRNLVMSARNVREILHLKPEDLCLNVMPLFHIHGIVAALLASLEAGGSVICASGFQSDNFGSWLAKFSPTWYTAVPTIHRAVLDSLARYPETSVGHSLKFIRSSSSALPPSLMDEMEETFHLPVIEAYGMTEAAHQMACNPLPPGERKPGSVGLAAGPDVAIMDEKGNLLQPMSIGEIVIRGDNVMAGYENNPEANASAFSRGWFRTGDQGYLDEDRYLFISGRIKEIINRGGEKISPREIDEALMGHPDVAQGVAFAIPHPNLGEDIAAAVVLRGDGAATAREIREFAFSRLSDFKVPTQVLIVDEIPKGSTGKLQRIGLAEKLAYLLKPEYTAPEGPVESALVEIWAKVLGLSSIGAGDNFFALGGDSLSATRVISRIKQAFDLDLPLDKIFREPVLRELAIFIETFLLEEIEALSEENVV